MQSWKTLFSFTTTAHLVVLVPALVLSTISGFVQPVQTIFFGNFFDTFAQFASGKIEDDKFMEDSFMVIYIIIGVTGLAWISKGGSFCLWVIYGELQSKIARSRLFDSLFAKEIDWYDSRPHGVASTISRLQTYIRESQLATSQPLGLTIGNISDLISSLSVALYFNWRLTLAVIAGVPILVLVLSMFAINLQQAINSQTAASTKATKIVNHVVKNPAMVKCYNSQLVEIKDYEQHIRVAASSYLKQAWCTSIQIGFSRFATFSMILGGIFYGGYLIHHGLSSTGSVTTAFLSCATALRAAENIWPNFLVLEKGQAAILALRQVIDHIHLNREVMPMHQGLVPKSIDGDIEFCDVSFSYSLKLNRAVLHRINLFFPARELSFVIGRSGSGKSTLGNLLLKCYMPNHGSIRIDGIDLQKIDTGWLRNNVTVVSQHGGMFNETIYRNVALGRQDQERVLLPEVENCLDFAVLSETVSQLVKGVDTKTGTNGSKLSGGQIQRITLARAKLRDTPILLLDECTSALDQTTRRTIMRNIRQWRQGKTTIIITHDLNQLTKNDFTYVLDNGSVVAEGYRRTMSPIEHISSVPAPLSRKLEYSSTTANIIDASSLPLCDPEHNVINNVEKMMDSIAQLRPNSISIPLTRVQERVATSRIFTINSPIDRSSFAIYANQPSLNRPNSAFESIRLHGKQMLDASCSRSRQSRFMSIHQATLSQYMQFAYSTGASMKVVSSVSKNESTKTEIETFEQLASSDTLAGSRHKSKITLVVLLHILRSDLSTKQYIQLFSGSAATLLHAACLPSFSFLMIKLFQTWSLPTDWQTPARQYAFYMLAVAITDGLASFYMHLTMEVVSQAWIDTLRARAFKNLTNRPISWFEQDENTPSSICSVLDQSAEEMRSLVSRFIPLALVAIFMMSIALIWSLVLCWTLSLLYAASLPFLYLATKMLERVSCYWEHKTNAIADSIGDVFEETFSNITTVRALTLESYFHEKHINQVEEAFDIGVRRGAYCGILFGFSDSTINFVTAGLFAYATVLAKNVAFSPMAILTTLSLLLFSTGNCVAIVSCIPQIASSLDAASRLSQLSNIASTSCEQSGSVKLSRNTPEFLTRPIIFTDLSFWYPSRPESPAIAHLNLKIAPGNCTAIVGASGSGKSTIAALLTGLIQPTATLESTIPHVQIFGHDILTLHLPTLRNLVIMVPQTPILIPGTIRENILYGEIDISLTTESNLRQAAKSAGIHDFITTLPKGYNTILGGDSDSDDDGGTNVSGGQAQRIAIARALVRNPQILILDEPTSALDDESANVIRNTIRNLISRKTKRKCHHDGVSSSDTRHRIPMTVILITHSIDMMKCADHIVVMDKGSLVEQGKFDDLMRLKGGFWEMVTGEKKDDDDDDDDKEEES